MRARNRLQLHRVGAGRERSLQRELDPLAIGSLQPLLGEEPGTLGQYDRGNTLAAVNVLEAFINEVEALLAAGTLTLAEAEGLLAAELLRGSVRARFPRFARGAAGARGSSEGSKDGHDVNVMFSGRRRRRILQEPFPDAWRVHLEANMAHFRHLEPSEAQRLCQLVQVFVAEKHWEGCGGLELTDEIRATIAGQACLLLLGLDHVFYRDVETILVYPSTVVPKRAEEPMFAPPVVVRDVVPVIGEAHRRGPVILTWDAVRHGGRHPERGHNVVYHEFAHKLDMLNGAVDGVPPLSRKEYKRWVEVCQREYDALREQFEAGVETFLDPYGRTNPGEFFAVATEYFFDKGLEMAQLHAALYDVLRAFYRQDPAQRELRTLQALEADVSAREKDDP